MSRGRRQLPLPPPPQKISWRVEEGFLVSVAVRSVCTISHDRGAMHGCGCGCGWRGTAHAGLGGTEALRRNKTIIPDSLTAFGEGKKMLMCEITS